MPRPLCSNLARATLQLGTGNAGLWYDKLCDRWNDDWSLSGDGDFERPPFLERPGFEIVEGGFVAMNPGRGDGFIEEAPA